MPELSSTLSDNDDKSRVWRMLLESISEPLVALSHEFRYIYINDAAEKTFGMKSGDLLNKKIWDVFPFLKDTEFQKACQSVIQTKSHVIMETYFPDFGHWVEESIYPGELGITIRFKIITGRKKEEQHDKAVIRSNSFILDSMRDLYLLLDSSLNIIDANSSACQLLEYSKEELVSLNYSFLNGSLQFQQILHNIRENIGTNDFVNAELSTRTGATIEVEISANEILMNENICYALIGRDVSFLKKTRQEIRVFNERFERIANATKSPLWEIDAVTGDRWANDAYQNLFGLKKTDPVADTQEWKSRIHPDDVQAISDGWRKAMESGAYHWAEEYKFFSFHQGWVHLYDKSYIIRDQKGKITKMFGSIVDITEIKNAEKQILAEKDLSDRIINSLPGTFYMFNEKGRIVRWNKNLETVLGLTRGEIAGMQPWDFFDATGEKLIKNKIAQVFRTGKAELEAELVLKNNVRIPYFYTAQSIDIEGEKFFLGTGFDLTDIREAQKALLDMEQKVLNQQVQEQKSISRAIIKTQEKERNHIGGELHDNVNQLLAGTRLYLSMAIKAHPELKADVNYPIQLIENCIQEIRNLTHKYVIPQKNVNLEQLSKGLIQNMNMMSEMEISLQYQMTEDSINDDLKINIYRILQELLNNAIKHSGSSKVSVCLASAGGKINLVVEDNGKGFQSSIKKEGVGLFNISNRINAYDGTMEIFSTPGAGCKFTIFIPVSG